MLGLGSGLGGCLGLLFTIRIRVVVSACVVVCVHGDVCVGIG